MPKSGGINMRRRKSANIINGGAVNARKRASAKQAGIGISAWHGRRRRVIARTRSGISWRNVMSAAQPSAVSGVRQRQRRNNSWRRKRLYLA
jgi:hypothetical protein